MAEAMGHFFLTVFRILLMPFLKLLWRIFKFFGLYWILAAFAPSLIYEWVTHKNSEALPPLVVLTNVLIVLAAICIVLTTVQNIVRMIKKDGGFNIYRLIFGQAVKKKKGIEAKTDGQTVALKSAGDLSGFVFGKQGGKYVTMPESADGHMLIIGGAGSGKTAAIAIPTLMSWQARVFAIDVKGELYDKTKAKRRGNVKVFDPTDPDACGYDPFYILRRTDDVSGTARDIALSLLPLPADIKDPFWIKSGQNLLTGLIIYYFCNDLSFADTMIEIKSRSIKAQIAEIMLSNNEKAKIEIGQFDDMDDKTLSGVFAEVSNHITVFASSDDLQRALSGNGQTITPDDLENGFDIFCKIPEHKIDQWKDLLGLICNQFLKAFERRPESNNTPILFLIDEFPRLGKIETISNGLATLRSKKVHIALVVQSKSQLNALYGQEVSEVIVDNCAYKAILKASEPNTQEWCSKLVGTFEKTKKSSSYNADASGIGKGSGASTTTEEKRIIKPEEFAYLNDVVCLFPNGYRRIEKAFYFKEKAFSDT